MGWRELCANNSLKSTMKPLKEMLIYKHKDLFSLIKRRCLVWRKICSLENNFTVENVNANQFPLVQFDGNMLNEDLGVDEWRKIGFLLYVDEIFVKGWKNFPSKFSILNSQSNQTRGNGENSFLGKHFSPNRTTHKDLS